MELARAAFGAQAGRIDPPLADARRFQLAAHRFRQVDVRPPVYAELRRHFRAYFVAALADGRS